MSRADDRNNCFQAMDRLQMCGGASINPRPLEYFVTRYREANQGECFRFFSSVHESILEIEEQFVLLICIRLGCEDRGEFPFLFTESNKTYLPRENESGTKKILAESKLKIMKDFCLHDFNRNYHTWNI